MRISDWSSDVCSSDLEFGRRLRKAIALGYVGDPEEDIGGAVLMLCSDESRYITGMTIFADGGLHLTPLALFDLSEWDEQHSSFNPTHEHAIERFGANRSEEHTSELQSHMRSSYAAFLFTKNNH